VTATEAAVRNAGLHFSAFHPAHGKAGTAINLVPTARNPEGDPGDAGISKPSSAQAGWKKSRHSMAELGSSIIAWITNLIFSSQRMAAG
jgi:hypothetical protein